MEHVSTVGRFLRSRRARLQPEDVGLISAGRRRVPGLRRDEVAQLVGISVDYYAKIERGDVTSVHEDLLKAFGRALLLDEAEQLYLQRLAASGPAAGAPADVDPSGPIRFVEAARGFPL